MINRIRDVRRARNLTLEEVAQRCDPPTTAQTIGRLETGTRTLSLGWMNRIAAALDVDAAELVRLPQDAQLTITALLGANGAGKTTLAMAPLWALTGSTDVRVVCESKEAATIRLPKAYLQDTFARTPHLAGKLRRP